VLDFSLQLQDVFKLSQLYFFLASWIVNEDS